MVDRSVAGWENEDEERASRANIPPLVEGMAEVLASPEVQQETFELFMKHTQGIVVATHNRNIVL